MCVSPKSFAASAHDQSAPTPRVYRNHVGFDIVVIFDIVVNSNGRRGCKTE